MEQEERVGREPQDSAIPTHRFAKGPGMRNPLNRTGGTCPQNCMTETPRNSVSELHLGKFPDSAEIHVFGTSILRWRPVMF